MKKFYQKHREIILYVLFGVLTTVVSWLAYLVVFEAWKSIAGISETDSDTFAYNLAFVVSKIAQWVTGVLFAFFTNRKWVFTDADRNVSVVKQLIIFASGRVFTFFLDLGLHRLLLWLLTTGFPQWEEVPVFNLDFTVNVCDLICLFVVGAVIVVTNYILSKVFVFKKKKES